MTGWVILAVYALGFVVLWRRFVWTILAECGDRADFDDLIFSLILGTVGVAFWPLVVFAVRVRRLCIARHGSVIVALQPRHVRRAERQEALERENREQQYRIALLERELGVGKGRVA